MPAKSHKRRVKASTGHLNPQAGRQASRQRYWARALLILSLVIAIVGFTIENPYRSGAVSSCGRSGNSVDPACEGAQPLQGESDVASSPYTTDEAPLTPLLAALAGSIVQPESTASSMAMETAAPADFSAPPALSGPPEIAATPESGTLGYAARALAPRPSAPLPSGSVIAAVPPPGFTWLSVTSTLVSQRKASAGFMWPVLGVITQPFGVPELGVGSPHTGIDIDQPQGSPVRAAQAGRVVFSGGDPCCGLGYWAEVDHGHGWSTLYGHLMRPPVVLDGASVQQGQIIGFSGNTGFSTGPHVHFEVRYDDIPIDPLRYLTSAFLSP